MTQELLALAFPQNHLRVDGARVLAEPMVCNTCLKRLNLVGGRFRDEHVCAVSIEEESVHQGVGTPWRFWEPRAIAHLTTTPEPSFIDSMSSKYVRASYGGIARMAKL